jgi:uncharacterized protein with HEPN domain
VRDDLERLRDIQKAIHHILNKTVGGRSAFNDDEMLRVWVLHHLQIIGEAARSLSAEFRQRHPDKVWTKAAGMRNIVVHHYFEINATRIWNVVEEDLPSLRDRVESLLREQS